MCNLIVAILVCVSTFAYRESFRVSHKNVSLAQFNLQEFLKAYVECVANSLHLGNGV